MRALLFGPLMMIAPLASAAVLNVEFKFAPFQREPEKDRKVTTVAGKAQVFINNVPFAEQEVRRGELPVLFEDREVQPAVWISMHSAGAVVRKGKNKMRIEFTPLDSAKTYRAQLRWASVMDEVTEETGPGTGSATNQANEGVDDRKEVKGKVVFEREFTADFALDRPWHHYPAISSVSEEDKQQIAALLKTRAEWFKPDFAAVYQAIEASETLKVEMVRKAQCLEAAHKAGVRLSAPPVAALNFTTVGGPEVVVTRKRGPLFGLDEKTIAAVKDKDKQVCAGMVLTAVYPGRLAVVRTPEGTWETVD